MSESVVLLGDCVERMREMDEASIDAIVTDPPYGLHFMGKSWDQFGGPTGKDNTTHTERGGAMHAGKYDFTRNQEFQREMTSWAVECLRILKPGGHLLAFGGTRTYHRLACAVEDAGFEIRDSLIWLYGSGFPKSLDVSKAIDRPRNEDKEPKRIVAAWLRSHLDDHRAVAVHFGVDESMVRFWIGTHGPTVQTPTLEQWAELKDLLDLPDDMDVEVWRLNGRKGQPGENWEKREKVGRSENQVGVGWAEAGQAGYKPEFDLTVPSTPEAQKWNGWGTALKPGHEPIVVARKPLSGTVAQNVTEYGTGALNIDGTRIDTDENLNGGAYAEQGGREDLPGADRTEAAAGMMAAGKTVGTQYEQPAGRWPANTALSHLPECGLCICERGVDRNLDCPIHGDGLSEGESESTEAVAPSDPRPLAESDCAPGCPIAELDEQSGERSSGYMKPTHTDAPRSVYGQNAEGGYTTMETYGDSGGASRFFANFDYQEGEQCAGISAGDVGGKNAEQGQPCESPGELREDTVRFRYQAKASRGERNAGLDGFEEKARQAYTGPVTSDPRMDHEQNRNPAANNHPTVKPIDLMRWLVRLVTPPGGTVLDPFTGSGTTGIAAVLEGFDFIGIEREAEYVEIAKARIQWWSEQEGETEEILIRAGLSERIEREHAEAGQLGLEW